MEIPFNSIKVQTERIRKPFLRKVNKLLSSYRFILDENVAEFEQQWATYCRAKYAVGVSSGSDALYLALKAMNIGVGDEVITQGNAYNASVVAILRTGATPRFADVDAGTFSLTSDEVRKLFTERTKAVLLVHLYGIVAWVSDMKKLGIPIIQDCAQAHGTRLEGDIACFSFYPTKSLGAFGDGGAIVTNNKLYRDKVIAMRDLGQTKKNEHTYIGHTMRLDPIQALALLLQLPYLNEDLEQKRGMVDFYNAQLGKWCDISFPHIYPALFVKREAIQKKLQRIGVHTQRHYPTPVYRQPFYVLPVSERCPLSEVLCESELSLPLFLGLTRKQQEYICDVLTK